MSWLYWSCRSFNNRSARQPVATWNQSSPKGQPTSSSTAHMQRRGTVSKIPIFCGKGEAVALSQNHRPAGVGTDLWFLLTHPFLKQQHPEQGAQYQTISRCLLQIFQEEIPRSPPGQPMPVPPFHLIKHCSEVNCISR